MNGRRIRLPLLDPEERLFAIAKPPKIGMIAFALVGREELDIKRPQGRLIERQRTITTAPPSRTRRRVRSDLRDRRPYQGRPCRLARVTDGRQGTEEPLRHCGAAVRAQLTAAFRMWSSTSLIPLGDIVTVSASLSYSMSRLLWSGVSTARLNIE
jgi:hypothetical protein